MSDLVMPTGIHFDRDGLIPVVVQEETTHDVLLLGYMNSAALQRTLETGLAHFWSRSRQKLWQKGETSGHAQEVVSLHLNCEGNSLLLRVHQRGDAACHDGYHSCYYRQLNGETWEITQPRLFDPAQVYDSASRTAAVPAANRPASADTSAQADPLAESFRRIYRAYEYMRDHNLEAVSGTSRRLRHPDQPWLRQRAAQELGELAGVLAGTHTHTSPTDDTILEGRQVCYWLLARAVAEHLPFEEVTPHALLRAGFETGEAVTEAAAELFALEERPLLDDLRAGLYLVGGACAKQGVSLLALAEAELADLAQKSYLAPDFWEKTTTP
ncbi:MAG TPA: phosphoribosyl-AMP cyclohydrolase [Ktedonobacterales bacterium]|nr:phosphoribosyl-AMP cyclohydrolase [Ktedonobacterales bacterium]